MLELFLNKKTTLTKTSPLCMSEKLKLNLKKNLFVHTENTYVKYTYMCFKDFEKFKVAK